MKTNRRFMLKTLGLGAAGFTLAPWNAPQLRADPKDKRPKQYYIFAYFQGGWDITQSLDPRDFGTFTDDKSGTTGIELGYDRLPKTLDDGVKIPSNYIIQPKGSNIDFGPAMVSFANAGHHDVSCIVRGVPMDTVTHEVGRRYFLTGMVPNGLNAKGSSMPTRIVANQGGITAIPNLVVRLESYNQGDPAYASGLKVNSVTDLLVTLQDGPNAPSADLRALIDEFRTGHKDCDPVRLNDEGLLSLIKSAQAKSRFLVSGGLREHFDFFNTKDPKMVEIKARYGITSTTSSQAQAAVAFQSIKNNIAQCISIELAGGLDTHGSEWADDHINRLNVGFNSLATLVSDLKREPHPEHPGTKLIDHTTIVCFSEFGRTAKLNNRDGRDHSVCNAALLIGAGIPHNKVIGASSNFGMNPEAIDPISGQIAKAGGQLVTPTRIMASIMENAGYDTDKLRIDGFPCLMQKT